MWSCAGLKPSAEKPKYLSGTELGGQPNGRAMQPVFSPQDLSRVGRVLQLPGITTELLFPCCLLVKHVLIKISPQSRRL